MHKNFFDLYFPKEQNEPLFDNKRYESELICWHDPLQFYAKMGHLSREETMISKWLSALRGSL